VHAIEVHVGVVDGELAAGRGTASVHHQWRLGAVGLGCAFDTPKLIVHTGVVKRRWTGPDTLDDAPPFGALRIAFVMLLLRDPEHLELVLVPATDDVHAEAALANMVRCGHLLGSDKRMV
jgi:hypothetical protein